MFSRVASRISPRWALATTAVATCTAYYFHSHQPVYTASATPSTSSTAPDQLVCIPTVKPQQLELIQLIYMTRHGARTAFAYSPGMDKNKFTIEWGKCNGYDGKPENAVDCGRAQLTPVGEHQLYNNGQIFRNIYVANDPWKNTNHPSQETQIAQRISSPNPAFTHPGFLSPQFNPNEVLLRSSDILRTKLSLTRFIQGVYPGVDIPTVVSNIKANPISREYLFPNPEKCGRLKQLMENIFHSHEWSAYIRSAEVEHVRRLLAAMYNVDTSVLMDKSQFTIIADELWCRKAQGMPHILGSSDDVINKSHEVMTKFFAVECGIAYTHPYLKNLVNTVAPRREHLTLTTGPVIKELVGYMEDAVHQHDQPKMEQQQQQVVKEGEKVKPPYYRAVFFAGHDSTLAPLLEALNLFEYEWPKVGENVTFEIMKDKNAPSGERSSYHVRILYNQKERALVSYETLYQHMKKFIPMDMARQCERTDGVKSSNAASDWALDG